ncbi:MAG: ribosome biogenesis GTPase [Gammaproteobacteria bacterium]|jgi:ribosome biogenesis GTPase
MAKRRLSKQQQKRIQSAQQASSSDENFEHGLILSHQGGQVLVETSTGSTIECLIKSNLGNIVCGDRVAIEETEQKEFRVVSVLPRDNLLQRIDGFNQVRSVAANITQLIICLSVLPEPNFFLLDQYLLSAEQQGIDSIIIFNKIDLEPDSTHLQSLRDIYEPLGYRIIATSIKNGIGMDEIKLALNNNRSVLSGVSGVGKSSLSNWLLPTESIKTATISVANAEGRHTTRSSKLYHLPDGGELIDTPGVRGFNPMRDRTLPISTGFREIQQRAEHCKFHNCRHRIEPNCAVIDAVKAGAISKIRYEHYLKLLEQSD